MFFFSLKFSHHFEIVFLTNLLLTLADLSPCPRSLSSVFLKTSGVKFELITDREIYDLIMDNIRGGLSFVGQRYAITKHYLKHLGLPPLIDKYGREIEILCMYILLFFQA